MAQGETGSEAILVEVGKALVGGADDQQHPRPDP